VDIVLKIRGIYATALTRFFLDRRFRVALPSEAVAERFCGASGLDVFQGPDVEIRDLENKHGVVLEGEGGSLDALITHMGDCFCDVVTRRRANDIAEIEFPFVSKLLLDEIRNTVVPTLLNHHRLKIIASDQVDRIEENTLAAQPERREALGCSMEKEWIWDQYEIGKEIAIEHVKLDGRVLRLSEGEVVGVNFAERSLILRRSKFKGRSKYDGLGISKLEGDYAVSEIREWEWHYRHTYFRAQGERIGAYYNINTPVEFYPDRIRYVDLEIDVVQFPEGGVDVVDEGELAKRFEQGYLSAKMREKAMSQASKLKRWLISLAGSSFPAQPEGPKASSA
jgi:protein associated with RNAse G/E